MTIFLRVGYNGEGGWKEARVGFDRVPAQGERIEFRNPDGAADGWDEELSGMVCFVAEVAWIAPAPGAKAEPLIFMQFKGEYEP